MSNRPLRLLVVLATAAVVLGAAPGAANAGAPPDVRPSILEIPAAGGAKLECAQPYLATAFGPIAQCISISLLGVGTPGLYSPITGQFNRSPGGGPVQGTNFRRTLLATDGFSAQVIGYGIVTRPGNVLVVYATQYSGDQARTGSVNLSTDPNSVRFASDGPWFTIIS